MNVQAQSGNRMNHSEPHESTEAPRARSATGPSGETATDSREFTRVCHAAARIIGGRIVEFRFPHGPTPNFHQAIIAHRDSIVAVVGARDFPVTAVARPRDLRPPRDAGPLSFIDHPELIAALTGLGRYALTRAALDAPFRHADWPHIPAAEVAYWRPETVGEALFGYRD